MIPLEHVFDDWFFIPPFPDFFFHQPVDIDITQWNLEGMFARTVFDPAYVASIICFMRGDWKELPAPLPREKID